MELTLTQQEKANLRLLQKQAKERWLYVRLTTVLMLSEGFSVVQVSTALGIDDNTVYRAGRNYRSMSLSCFLRQDYCGQVGNLSYTQLSQLRRHISSCLYTTSAQICQWVKQSFGVGYTPEGMARLLGRIGFVYKKTKQVPCEADPAAQEQFMERLGQVLCEPDSAVYFMDAVHPTHNTRSLYGWIESGREFELPTVSGRDRVNINGAVNAKDPTQIVSREDKCINAQSTKELYRALLEKHSVGTVFVVSDNARYYRNAELQEWLGTQGRRVVQVFLPPYSPNLNIIERLWKLLRKKVIDPVFYRTKEEFRAGVLSFFKNTA
jgi:transposase